MPADDPLKSFSDAREALRANAKWVLAGTGAVLTLVVGGATISQLGSLSPVGDDAWRFWLAVIPGLLGLALCSLTFGRAVGLLLIEVVVMGDFVNAKRGDRKLAYEAAERQFGGTLSQGSVKAFVKEYDDHQTIVNTANTQAAVDAAQAQLDLLQPKYDQIGQVMTTTFVSLEYQDLMRGLRFGGAAVLLLFLVFAWAANPPKDVDTLLAKPVLDTIQTNQDSQNALKAAGVAAACYAPSAHVIVFADEAHGVEAGVLTSPGPGVACLPTRVRVIAGQVWPA